MEDIFPSCMTLATTLLITADCTKKNYSLKGNVKNLGGHLSSLPNASYGPDRLTLNCTLSNKTRVAPTKELSSFCLFYKTSLCGRSGGETRCNN